MQTCFVIPTYNEASNIVPLLQRLTELHPGAEMAFLVVDDQSPDGTADRVRDFAISEARIHLLEGPKRGLGTAYLRGITHALDTLGAEAVVQMDADFSHDPGDTRRLLARLAEGADVVIGSRYVAGGSLDSKWPVRRRLLSRWGNRLARLIAGLKGVRDCTAGFRAIRASALRTARVEEIRTRGYAFQVVLLHRLMRSGAQVLEEPVHFRDREHGTTKLGIWSLLEFFASLWQLRLADHRDFLRFALVGLSGVPVNLGSFYLLLELNLHKYLASPIAIEISIITNFLINNYWTFADRTMANRGHIRALNFNLISMLALGLSYGTFLVLSVLFPAAHPVLLQGCGIVPAALLNYHLNSHWTFRSSPQPANGLLDSPEPGNSAANPPRRECP